MIVADASECYFYHSMELPEIGTINGDWDLRACVDDYLGNFDFNGKRALDVGAASGFLTFEMEKRGADVVSYDILDGANWNVVPHFKSRESLARWRTSLAKSSERLKRSYWLSHRLLASRASAYYGDIYALPRELGDFDVVLYGTILNHLRDPFQALYSGCRLSVGSVIVTGSFPDNEAPVARFRPSGEDPSINMDWWHLSVGAIRNMLGVLGFEIDSMKEFTAYCLVPGHVKERNFRSIRASRVEG
jgi:hypothetical protein